MKARIERDALRRALRTVAPAVVNKPGQHAMLSGVHIDAADRRLRITATDLQWTITAEVDALVSEPGSIVAPARLFTNYLERSPEGSVWMETRDERLVITIGESTFDLNLLPSMEWPRVGPIEGGDCHTLDEGQIDLVRRVIPFGADDTNRPVLAGVRFSGDFAGATDSYRLGMATLTGHTFPGMTIPRDHLSAALKDATEAEIRSDDHRATISHDACTWTTSLLVEDEYPPLDRFLRDESPHRLRFGARTLTDVLSRTQLLDEKGKAVRIQQDGDKAMVSIEEPDLGTIEEVVTCDGDFADRLGFNSSHLASVIAAVGTDEVTFEILDNLKPVIARGDGIVALVMPVRIPA